jgi:hypothetical protein
MNLKKNTFRYSAIVRQDSGVGFYRLVQPLRFLKRQGLAEVRMTPFSGRLTIGEQKDATMPYPDKLFMYITEKADVIWSNFTVNYDEMLKMLNLRHHWGAKLIIDIDDNMYAVARDNPGKKNADRLIENIELSLSIADGLTVSVPTLKDTYAHLNPNIFVNPNGIDFDLLKPKNYRKGKLRIGWEGAYGHRADLELIYPAIRELKKNYDFTFVIFGMTPKDGMKPPPFEVEYHGWEYFGDEVEQMNVYPYYDKLVSLNLDIAVAPLIDSAYNRCKSNLRILENSALKIPIVASPVLNYQDMPVLYASTNYDWYAQLEKLIKNQQLRSELGQRQYDFVFQHFNETDIVHPLHDWMRQLPRRTDLQPDRQ